MVLVHPCVGMNVRVFMPGACCHFPSFWEFPHSGMTLFLGRVVLDSLGSSPPRLVPLLTLFGILLTHTVAC